MDLLLGFEFWGIEMKAHATPCTRRINQRFELYGIRLINLSLHSIHISGSKVEVVYTYACMVSFSIQSCSCIVIDVSTAQQTQVDQTLPLMPYLGIAAFIQLSN